MSMFSYENQGSTTYLVCSFAPEETLDTMSIGMLTNNRIPGLAQALFMQVNTDRFIKYNVSSRVPVSQLFSGIVNKKRLLGVFSGIVNALICAEDYMIDSNSILLDLNYIFADVSTCDTVLVCVPVVSAGKTQTDLGTFFKNIMFSTQFDQTENCSYVAKILSYLNSAPVFSVSDFAAVIKGILAEGTAQPIRTDASQPAYQRVPQPAPQPAYNPEIKPVPQPVQQQEMQPRINPIQQVPPVAPQPVPMPPVPPVKPPTEAKPVRPAESSKPQVQPSFQIPGKNQPDTARAQQETQPSGDSISLFYLLQHYNKDNAALYKAQKEAAKQAKQTKQGSKSASKQKKGKEPQPQQQMPAGYAIPGQPQPPVPPVGGYGTAGQNVPPIPQTYQPGYNAPVQMNGFQPGTQGTPVSGMGLKSQPLVAEADFGDTIYKDSEEDSSTTVMRSDREGQRLSPQLVRRSNNEKIPIDKSLFHIGRDENYNDYVVSNNRSVGRSHCHIVFRDGEYFIVDDNSKNHTYVDGKEITSGTEVKLTHGTRVSLSDEEFEFRLF